VGVFACQVIAHPSGIQENPAKGWRISKEDPGSHSGERSKPPALAAPNSKLAAHFAFHNPVYPPIRNPRAEVTNHLAKLSRDLGSTWAFIRFMVYPRSRLVERATGKTPQRDSGPQSGESSEKPLTLASPEAKLVVHFPFLSLALKSNPKKNAGRRLQKSVGGVLPRNLTPSWPQSNTASIGGSLQVIYSARIRTPPVFRNFHQPS
jgi:hypothetical protein